MLRWIEPGEPLPPAHEALREPDGLLAAGRDLSPARLLEAYRGGVFPWYSAGQPVLWWSPDPRMVLFLDEFRVRRSLRKILRAALREDRWRVTHDRAFDRVIRACAEPRDGATGTWITPAVMRAYEGLHAAGHAHSVEVWEEGDLVGGLYGVSMGRMFYGESMFARRADASKAALAALVPALRDADFRVIDCQQDTRHLASLGGRTLPRPEFLDLVRSLATLPDAHWPAMCIDLSPYG